jgi:hypothetical protein
MGRRIDHQNANNQRRILENGHESVTDGSRSDGIGRGASRVFDVTGASASRQQVTVRRIAPGSGRRIDPKSEEGRRIAAAVLAGKTASQMPKVLRQDGSAFPSQKPPRQPASVERKPSRQEIIEASRQIQGFQPKQNKRRLEKKKNLFGRQFDINPTSESQITAGERTVANGAEKAAKRTVNVKKRDKLRKLIASMFGPLLPLRHR